MTRIQLGVASLGMVMGSGRKDIEHFGGCLLGGAAGDALGAPVEFDSLARIRERLGPAGVTGYPAGATGRITDDTQMTLFTAEGLLRAYARGQQRGICHPPSVVQRAYIRWLHTQGLRANPPLDHVEDDGWLLTIRALYHRRAPGNTCISALQSGVMGTVGQPVNTSKGCGGVMRMAPVGLLYEPARAFEMGCDVAATTHGHPSGYLAAGSFACMIAGVIAGEPLREAIDAAAVLLSKRPQHEECSRAIANALRAADEAPSAEVVEKLGAGWVAEEALAIAVYCALAAAGDFCRGVLLAVNHSGDSDSTGAIAGNLLGALLGRSAIPAGWLEGLEMREEMDQLSQDLVTLFRDDEEWWERYPGN